MADTGALHLARMERFALQGMQAEFDAVRAMLEARLAVLNERNLEIYQEIEARLGLPKGSITTTHEINRNGWTVETKPAEAETPTEETEAGAA